MLIKMRSLAWLVLPVLSVSCGGGHKAAPDAPPAIDAPAPDAPVETLGPAPALAIPCTDGEADVFSLPSGLPTMDDSHRGDVFHCAVTESLSAYKVNKQLDAYDASYTHSVPGAVQSGFWTYRVAYRTERNTVNGTRAEGDTAALLLVPEKPLAGAPLVVFAHGSIGFAPQCAPTHLDLSATAIDEDYPVNLYRLAGYGYTVIAPDYAGFSYGQPPGYFDAEDEAHSVLDATRAAAKLLTSPPDKVVIVGHSQGGHAALAAQSYAGSYGVQGTLIGVAAFAPLWTSMSLWGAAVTPAAGLKTSTDTSSILYAMAYAYSEGELDDGAGHGVDVFQAAKQAAAKDALLGGECYDTAKLQALGASPSDFFDSTYVSTVGGCALGGSCTDPLATTWKARWIADRPAIDPAGAPILIYFGGQDTFVTPGRAQCARNKIASDLGSTPTLVQYCFDPDAAHRDIIRAAAPDYVNQWIAAQAGIGPAPAACTAFPSTTMCPPFPVEY